VRERVIRRRMLEEVPTVDAPAPESTRVEDSSAVKGWASQRHLHVDNLKVILIAAIIAGHAVGGYTCAHRCRRRGNGVVLACLVAHRTRPRNETHSLDARRSATETPQVTTGPRGDRTFERRMGTFGTSR
jgi:hypothetical protein